MKLLPRQWQKNHNIWSCTTSCICEFELIVGYFIYCRDYKMSYEYVRRRIEFVFKNEYSNLYRMWHFRPDHQMLRLSRIIIHHLNIILVGLAAWCANVHKHNHIESIVRRSKMKHWALNKELPQNYLLFLISKVKLTSFYLFHILTFCHTKSNIAHLQQWTKYTPHSIYFLLSLHSTFWLLFDILNNGTGHIFLVKPNRTEETAKKHKVKKNNEIVQM